MHLEYVEFYDHWSDDDWQELDDSNKPADIDGLRCVSVGFLLAENDKFIRLIANLDGAPDSAGRGFGAFTILKSAIIRRRKMPTPK